MGSGKVCAQGLVGYGKVIYLYPGSRRKPLEGLKLEGRKGNVRRRRGDKLTLAFHMAYMENRLKGLRMNPADNGQSIKHIKCLHYDRYFIVYIYSFD